MLTSATCRLPPRPFVIDNDVLTLDKAYFLDTRAECGEVVIGPPLKWRRTTGEKPNHGHRGPLCLRGQRPRGRRAAEQRDERAALHSKYLVGAGEQRLRQGEARRLCGREINDEIEFGRLLDWQVAWLGATQNLIDVVAGAPEQVRHVGSIGHQTARFDEFPRAVHRWQARGQRQGIDANAVGTYERVDTDIKCIRAAFERLESAPGVFASPDF